MAAFKGKLVSFKELEQKIFDYVCELGREITRIMLESYDEELAASRDTKRYRDKGKRKTAIKTVYGAVEYSRKVCRTVLEDGRRAHVYLLDEAPEDAVVSGRGKQPCESAVPEGLLVKIEGRYKKAHGPGESERQITNPRGAGRKSIITEERIRQAKELKRKGYKIREIGREMGCSAGHVHKLINEQLEKQKK